MNYITLTIGDTEYKLRINTRGCVALEKALGYNPIQMFMDLDNDKLPKLTDMIVIFHAMLQALQHGLTLDKVYDIYDQYLADGHTMFDLVPVFIEVFQAGGFVTASTEEAEEEAKNA